MTAAMQSPIARRAIIVAAVAAIAIPAEGLRQVAYYDPPGVLTVCWGSTTDVVPGKVYTLDECRARLDTDLAIAVSEVERCLPADAPWQIVAAFSDAAFNLGPRVACDQARSTAARHLAAGRWREACEQLPRWNKASVAGMMVELPGLTKRRARERDLCLEGAEPARPVATGVIG